LTDGTVAGNRFRSQGKNEKEIQKESMMKRFLLLLVALAAFSFSAGAQNLQLKVGGGISTHYSDAQTIGSFKVGLGYEVEFDQHWTVTPSLLLYGKGWKNRDQRVFVYDEDQNQVFEDDGTPLTCNKSRTTTANYLELAVPFNYYFNVRRDAYIVLSAGPYVACGISGKQDTKGDTEAEGSRKLFYQKKTFKEQGVHRFDAGLTAGVGYQFPTHFTVGLEGDFGLARFSNVGDRNLSVLVTLSYQF